MICIGTYANIIHFSMYEIYNYVGNSMQQKHYQLIQTMMNKYITSGSYLAAELDVSLRTISSQIKEISQEFPDLITVTYKGYSIDRDKASKLLNDNLLHFPETKEERILHIIFKLLYESEKEHDINVLANNLFISSSLLRSYIPAIKIELSKYDISLRSKSNSISIIGNELDIRRALLLLCYNTSKSNYVDLKILPFIYPSIDIPFIISTIDSFILDNHLLVSDYSRNNFIMNIVIMVYRNKTNHLDNRDVSNNILKNKDLSHHLSTLLCNHYHIQLTSSDIYHIDLCIEAYTRDSTDSFLPTNDKRFQALFNTIILKLNNNYNYDFLNEESKSNFIHALYYLLIRAQNRIILTNPVTSTIKDSAPLTYNIAVYIAHIIKEETGLILSIDEIADITCNLMNTTTEIERNSHWKIEAVLVCPNYFDFSVKLLNSINFYFSKYIDIKKTVSKESDILYDDQCDLIITTVPLSFSHKQDSVLINMVLSEYDSFLIQSTIVQVFQKESESYLNTVFKRITKDNLFIIDDTANNKEEALQMIFDNIASIYPDSAKSIKKSVLERENIAPSELSLSAILSPIEYSNEDSFMFIYINKHGIEWNTTFVNLVILTRFDTKDTRLVYNVLSPLYHTLMDKQNVLNLIKSNSKSEFIEILTHLMIFE